MSRLNLARWRHQRLIRLVCRHRTGGSWNPGRPLLYPPLAPIRSKRGGLGRKRGTDGESSGS